MFSHIETLEHDTYCIRYIDGSNRMQPIPQPLTVHEVDCRDSDFVLPHHWIRADQVGMRT